MCLFQNEAKCVTTCIVWKSVFPVILVQYASALHVSPGWFRHNEHLRLVSGSVESYWCAVGLYLADKEGIFC